MTQKMMVLAETRVKHERFIYLFGRRRRSGGGEENVWDSDRLCYSNRPIKVHE
jgi:hypothetical protein